MREKLKPLLGRRVRYVGTFDRFGTKTGVRPGSSSEGRWVHITKPTLCLVNILYGATEVTDHLWMNVGTQLASLDLKPGDRVEFYAVAETYEKGYRGRRDDDEGWGLPPVTTDIHLTRPTKVRLLERLQRGQLTLDSEPDGGHMPSPLSQEKSNPS